MGRSFPYKITKRRCGNFKGRFAKNIINKINNAIGVIEKICKAQEVNIEEIKEAQKDCEELFVKDYHGIAIKKITEMREKVEKAINEELKLELDNIT